MTDASRKITGLAPRRMAPPLSRLLKSERDRAELTEPPAEATAFPTVEPILTETVPETTTTVVPPAAARPIAEDAKQPVTVRWTRGLRERSRAAYLATRSAERDETYSDMVAKAVETEIRRREEIHNSGQPFAGGEAQLPAGRPIG